MHGKKLKSSLHKIANENLEKNQVICKECACQLMKIVRKDVQFAKKRVFLMNERFVTIDEINFELFLNRKPIPTFTPAVQTAEFDLNTLLVNFQISTSSIDNVKAKPARIQHVLFRLCRNQSRRLEHALFCLLARGYSSSMKSIFTARRQMCTFESFGVVSAAHRRRGPLRWQHDLLNHFPRR
ncbi:hypothetical protein T10_1752 [Trichinella papuae]|uniref:Uncharacterized protein n=1 Tax=Trichinella papuae TaxID=268474 RepID=A0A0V1N3F0_9BILA|nr:hypothetical protein T10_11710 [Trichinella papuae]KRZ78507.1 hypothetical protein T10_1752 [Trichinella papuae]